MDLTSQSSEPLRSLRDQFLRAQLAGKRREAVALLVEEGLEKGHPIDLLQLEVIQSAQEEIGRLWQENEISIAQEHMATAIAQVALAHLYQRAAPLPPNGLKILVACVEGELHDFPARLVADRLELEGFDVRFLGASVPTDSLLGILEREKPELLALSVTMSFHLAAAKDALARVRAKFPALKVALGGHALRWSPQTVEELGGESLGPDARSACLTAKRLLQGKAGAA